jgi:hypothetical protein
MEDDMLGDDSEFGQLSDVTNVHHSDLSEKIFAFAALQAPELVVKV